MTASVYIKLSDVSVNIPVFNAKTRSIKSTLIGYATGGRLGVSETGVTCINSLSRVNLEISCNQRVGLVGHNGAGKSTLLRVLAKVYRPTTGTAEIQGTIGSLIGISMGIDVEATGVENIYIRAALLGIDKNIIDQNLKDIIEFTELGDFIHMPVRTYSTGMHMRLAFAVSTMIEPEILLMDEWLSVGDASFKKKAEFRLNGLLNRSKILVIASHSKSLIEKCCDKVVWLEHGEIKMFDSTETVLSRYFR